MPDHIILEQAVFGYRDGHNLLTSSTPLTPRVRQFLSSVSDSSGPEALKEFDGAYTGLPVPETDFYAFFCTWSAPEMPRPGCVWTHLILIQLADLARIPDLSILKTFCVRPNLPFSAAQYDQPLNLILAPDQNEFPKKLDQHRLRLLLRGLYNKPECSLVILDSKHDLWVNEILAIWSQQWPRLRREFTFSTGSLGDRGSAGMLFDLQIAPYSSERLWRKNGARTLIPFTSANLLLDKETLPLWVETAENDLFLPGLNQFREFLFDYGSDIAKPRESFYRLANIYEYQKPYSQIRWFDLLTLTATYFPSQSDAVRLKRNLTSIPDGQDAGQKLERAWAIASFLLSSEQQIAYPNLEFDFQGSAAALWTEKRAQTVSLLSNLVQKEERAAATSFAEGIAREVDASSFSAIAESHPELVPLIIRHNPQLSHEVGIWKLKVSIQTQVYETLARLRLGEESWSSIVGAMLIAETYVSIREAVSNAGEHAITGAFRWLEVKDSHDRLPAQHWRDALAPAASKILRANADLPPPQLAFTAWCASNDQVRSILTPEREDVIRLGASIESVPSPLRISTSFLLVAIGLRGHSENAATLILENFFSVHDALATGSHASESWWLLAPELPDLGWWRDWDRCERLRRAVVQFLSKHSKTSRLQQYASTSEEKKLARSLFNNHKKD